MLVLESFADSKLLDFSDLGQLTFRINRTLGVSRYVRHTPNSYMHARWFNTKAGSGGHMDEMYIKLAKNSIQQR